VQTIFALARSQRMALRAAVAGRSVFGGRDGLRACVSIRGCLQWSGALEGLRVFPTQGTDGGLCVANAEIGGSRKGILFREGDARRQAADRAARRLNGFGVARRLLRPGGERSAGESEEQERGAVMDRHSEIS